jgi:hypothetical protein
MRESVRQYEQLSSENKHLESYAELGVEMCNDDDDMIAMMNDK